MSGDKSMNKIKIGFLPLYLKLYDECCPDMRPQVEAFTAMIRGEYEKRNIEVGRSADMPFKN